MSDKTQELLNKAEAQAESASDAKSSISCAECEFTTAAEAETQFAGFKEKLFRVERWNAHAALMSFALFDEDGKKSERAQAKVGDFIRLTLAASGKSDWVKIARIEDEPDEIILTVRPTYNPTEKSEPDKMVTSHFFTEESSNNFCLQRKGEKIIFHVVGLDEKSNTHDTKNILETVRNAATANFGHYLGIQQMEWTQFCENFLKNPEK